VRDCSGEELAVVLAAPPPKIRRRRDDILCYYRNMLRAGEEDEAFCFQMAYQQVRITKLQNFPHATQQPLRHRVKPLKVKTEATPYLLFH